MAFNFIERLGGMLGQAAADRLLGHKPAEAEQAAPEAETPPAEVVAQAPVAEAAPVEEPVTNYTVEEVVAEAPAPEAPVYTPAPEAAVTYAEPAPVAEAYVAPVTQETVAPTADPLDAAMAANALPAEAYAAPVPEAPAEPVKSAEEIEEERLWAETDAAWAAGDFQKVTESLDALKALQPEDAAVIDEKIAAAQYNQAAAFEQAGDLNRALYLYQEAQRRNPNLGEASFAVERIQTALQPPAPVAEPEAPAAPVEQSYTVESGDSLWAIAERFYGDGAQYSRIFEANRDQLDNPDLIQPGQLLRIPA